MAIPEHDPGATDPTKIPESGVPRSMVPVPALAEQCGRSRGFQNAEKRGALAVVLIIIMKQLIMITLKTTLIIKALRFPLDENGEIVPEHTLMTVPAICRWLPPMHAC